MAVWHYLSVRVCMCSLHVLVSQSLLASVDASLCGKHTLCKGLPLSVVCGGGGMVI